MKPKWRWVVEYRSDIYPADELSAFRTHEQAQAECDCLNRDHSPSGRDYTVAKYRRIGTVLKKPSAARREP